MSTDKELRDQAVDKYVAEVERRLDEPASNTDGAAQGEAVAWYKHGPAYDAEANCDVWGISDVPYDRGEEQVMLMWVFHEADANRIIADHRKAQTADVLAKALEEARVEFDNIRGDWSEPRGYIREGCRIIDTALDQYYATTEEVTRS